MARRKRYSAEFKRQALKRADEPGVIDRLVCEELGVNLKRKFGESFSATFARPDSMHQV